MVEAEQDPKTSPPLKMAKIGHAELVRVMALAGYRGRAMNRREHNVCVIAGVARRLRAAIAREDHCQRIEGV